MLLIVFFPIQVSRLTLRCREFLWVYIYRYVNGKVDYA
jgi:hypothetical protein